MGYYRRPIRRRRCASQVAEAVARQSSADTTGWLRVPWCRSPDVPRRAVYLRFAVGQTCPDSRQQLGVFQAAYQLRNQSGHGSDAGRMLRPLFDWFNENLVAPKVTPAAVFWFKSDAAPCVGRIWEMIHVLASHDVIVWMMRSRHPGRVVYEDDYQVAAVPSPNPHWRPRAVV